MYIVYTLSFNQDLELHIPLGKVLLTFLRSLTMLTRFVVNQEVVGSISSEWDFMQWFCLHMILAVEWDIKHIGN